MQNEAYIRLGFFLGVLAAMALWELAAPRRPLRAPKTVRWLNNLSLTALNMLLVRFALPFTAVALAARAGERGWGLMGLVELPGPVEGLICIAVLDLLIYAQHVAFHLVKPLWRLHRMHHTDLDLDVTSGARFHPVEILLSMLIKFGAIVALGPPAWAVVAFEVILNVMAMFNHSNVRMPGWLDRALRLLVVTPDFHRIHHSVIISETDSNYGFNLSLWDRMFGTYVPQPSMGHEGMRIGLANYQDVKWLGLGWMLRVPLENIER